MHKQKFIKEKGEKDGEGKNICSQSSKPEISHFSFSFFLTNSPFHTSSKDKDTASL